MTRKEFPKKMERMLRALETDLAGRVQFTAQLRGMIGEIAQFAREEGAEDLPAGEELDRDALMKLVVREMMDPYTEEERDENCLRLLLRLDEELQRPKSMLQSK